MDYEKAYKGARERCRWQLANKLISEECATDLFRDIKESEDERIRKSLIKSFTNQHSANFPTVDGFTREQIIAYPEKQKEQRPSTPKYRVGEVMRTKQEAAEGITDGLPVIVSVDDNYYYCTNEKIPISEQEEYEFPPMNMRQKATEWSEEDENRFRNLIYLVEHSNEGKGIKEGFVKFINRLKSLPERFNPQPKQEWSEEDEIRLKEAIEVLDESIKYLPMGYGFSKDVSFVKDWLKSLRPQKKREWSEDDKGVLLSIKCVIDEIWHSKNNTTDCPNDELEEMWRWLNTLWERVEYPQSHWKPSEEQMKALKLAYEDAFECPESGVPHMPLKSLLSDLQKLL